MLLKAAKLKKKNGKEGCSDECREGTKTSRVNVLSRSQRNGKKIKKVYSARWIGVVSSSIVAEFRWSL